MNTYLDNAATTKPCSGAINAAVDAMKNNYGNPSSLHSMGVNAQKIVDKSRKIIADSLSCDTSCIYFTSGATESNNIAVLGTAKTYGKRKPRIITTTVEHPSVGQAVSSLEELGFEIVRISPNKNGEICSEEIINAVDENTCLVSMMAVNNETGYILPVKKTFAAIKRLYPDVITHCDAVQAFMKIPIKAKELNADLISISGHKIHAVKGIGALYVKKNMRLLPVTYGGKQEKGLRSGTESVPLIAAFGEAVDLFNPTINERYTRTSELKKYMIKCISKMDGINVNSPEVGSPYIINISVEGIRSEIMLHFLEQKNIFVSSGSACSKGAKSGVLNEFGIGDKLADSALRISFSSDNAEYDVKMLIDAIKEGQQTILRA